jgi:hypothetical protein
VIDAWIQIQMCLIGSKAEQPLLIVQGLADTTILPQITINAFNDTCGSALDPMAGAFIFCQLEKSVLFLSAAVLVIISLGESSCNEPRSRTSRNPATMALWPLDSGSLPRK